MLKFSFKIKKSTKSLLVAICSVPGCTWRVVATVKNDPSTFWVTKYLNVHICSIVDRIANRKRCTSKYIGRLFIDRVGIVDGVVPQHIEESMRTMFGMTLDYTTLYRALQYAQEYVRGSAEDEYAKLPYCLQKIEQSNRGSVVDLVVDDEHMFKYLFISFDASIRGFNYVRRVIVVDGTHLTSKYEGVLLIACVQDGNFQIFPLAFGIVDSECDASWDWFFTKLSEYISDEYPLVVVSDRHCSIAKACRNVIPWATQRICYYHLQQNIISNFNGKQLMYLVKGAAYAHTHDDYNRYMASLTNVNPALAAYLNEADPALWSRVYCPGDRYNIKTSNIAESIKSMLKKAKGYPITYLIEFITEKLDMMTVKRIDGWRFHVRGGQSDYLVDLEEKSCSCGVFGVEKIPCSHAIKAVKSAGWHMYTVVEAYYRKDYVYASYAANIMPNVEHTPIGPDIRCIPPIPKRKPNWQKKSRCLTHCVAEDGE
ncbi:PREDICTED: uncharacterized protein LOC104738290 [Camelina sativa]|uniref:Uncharacterized protein LOC104738290 n=1 Tax=Camelina sativa TaxID=90675 RepID=A0ABM0VIN9_CAMSA|nr:PREDICTED: uncharacterized protein LOC104738290 [Camelina sativa]